MVDEHVYGHAIEHIPVSHDEQHCLDRLDAEVSVQVQQAQVTASHSIKARVRSRR